MGRMMKTATAGGRARVVAAPKADAGLLDTIPPN
jgi:hypothetical protein